jgi:hypothetical protein
MTVTHNYDIANNLRYTIHPDHRNSTHEKSQWRITEDEECACFSNCHTSNWYDGHTGWGLHVVGGVVTYLGVGRDHVTEVFVAKFVADNDGTLWHGYPADHVRSHDRPIRQVLAIWLRDNVIPAAKVRKIGKGEPCKL